MPLDIAVGIFLAIGFTGFFHHELTRTIIAASIACTLLPDFDFIVEWLRHGSVGGKVIREHREISHFPLTFIPVVFIVWLALGQFWAALFGSAILFHFLHDSVGIGWGIKWWWPFSKKAYKFFSEKNGSFSRRFLISWNKEELQEVARRAGDPHWIRNIYFRFHPISAIEYLSLILAIITLLLWR